MNNPLLTFLAGGQDPAHVENLNADFASRLNAMFAASPGGLTINSGFRTVKRQQELWDAALAKYGDPEIADNWVARPGTSNHNSGAAVDLGYASPDVQKWVHDNAGAYGLNFPMSHEPWHIEMLDGQPVKVADNAPVPADPGAPPAPSSLGDMLAAGMSRMAAPSAPAAPQSPLVASGTGNVQGQTPTNFAALLDELQASALRPTSMSRPASFMPST